MEIIIKVPDYPVEHDNDLLNEYGATPIPKNMFIKANGKNVFANKIEENHALEQFFWSDKVVQRLAESLNFVFIEKTCCLMTPSLAHYWNETCERDEALFDIDTRFDYLPKFKYFDVTDPKSADNGDNFRLLVIDPPFFLIPIEQVRDAVNVITAKNYKTGIIIAFIKRGEKRLRTAFKEYNLKPTKFQLEYVSIKPNKWSNFVLYSNIELPGIKFIKEA